MFSVPRIKEQIVEVMKVIPMEQISKRVVEQIRICFQKFPQERIQQRILEEIVNVPVPQPKADCWVAKVFERRAVF